MSLFEQPEKTPQTLEQASPYQAEFSSSDGCYLLKIEGSEYKMPHAGGETMEVIVHAAEKIAEETEKLTRDQLLSKLKIYTKILGFGPLKSETVKEELERLSDDNLRKLLVVGKCRQYARDCFGVYDFEQQYSERKEKNI